MKISEFRNAIKSGVLKGNRWRVNVGFPDFTGSPSVGKQVSLLARSTTVPAGIIEELDIPWSGKNIFIPAKRTFEEFPLTILATQDMDAMASFMKWNNAMLSFSDSTALSSDMSDLVGDVTLELLRDNEAEDVIMTYILEDAWPRVVADGGMELDHENDTAIVTFNVLFRYFNLDIPGIST